MRPLARWISAVTLASTAAACQGGEPSDAHQDSATLADVVSTAASVPERSDAGGRVGIVEQRAARSASAGGVYPAPASVPVNTAAPSSGPLESGKALDASGESADQAPLVIHTGSATLEVDSLDVGVERVREIVRAIPGAYVANMSVESGREQTRRATLEVKLPVAAFDQLVAGLAPIGKVETVNVAAQEVTEEFVDLSARAENARRLEARLVELLARRTGKLEEVLTVERELARVREEIERYDGRLRFLRTRAATSTLALTVHEPLPVLGERQPHNPIAEALRQSWRNFVALVAGLVALSGVLIPLALLGYVAWLIFRRFHRRATAA